MPAQTGFSARKADSVRANGILPAQKWGGSAQTGKSPRKVSFARAKRISSAQKCRHPAQRGFSPVSTAAKHFHFANQRPKRREQRRPDFATRVHRDDGQLHNESLSTADENISTTRCLCS